MNSNPQAGLFEAGPFIEGLGKALKGVVRVIGSRKASTYMSCGWLITDSLVVVPEYAVQHDGMISCEVEEEKDAPRITAMREEHIPSAIVAGGIGVLRLKEALRGRALSLEARTPTPDTSLCILQMLERRMFGFAGDLSIDDQWLIYTCGEELGSAGSPVVDTSTWAVVGMHAPLGTRTGRQRALRLDTLLKMLRPAK